MAQLLRPRQQKVPRYTSDMRSRSATDIDERRAARLAAMTPGARVALAAGFGEEGLA